MDNTARAPERAARTAPTIEVPSGWPEVQAELAAGAGLSLLLIEGRQPPSLAISNNNSICHAFQSSPTHAHLCEPYCGEAYQRVWKRQPEGGLMGEGTSPCKTILCRVASTSGSGTGTADINAFV